MSNEKGTESGDAARENAEVGAQNPNKNKPRRRPSMISLHGDSYNLRSRRGSYIPRSEDEGATAGRNGDDDYSRGGPVVAPSRDRIIALEDDDDRGVRYDGRGTGRSLDHETDERTHDYH